jgi:Lon protease-like protein
VPTEIALFPLSTVLFPGGLLPLRIFETRYVDMVGRCMRRDESFGVVLSKDGSETNSTVETAAIGTTARIVDFQTLPGGLLGLLCRGESRFRVTQRTQQSDGLNLASVEWLAHVPATALEPQYQPLVRLLRDALSRMDKLSRFIEPDYDSADWVSYRLADLMPLPVLVQQRLLEIDDPNERLGLLAPLLDVDGHADP